MFHMNEDLLVKKRIFLPPLLFFGGKGKGGGRDGAGCEWEVCEKGK